MPRRYYSSVAQRTTLATGMDATTTTMIVSAATGFPSQFPFTLIVDPDTINEEIVNVSARSGTTLTVVRGQDGTTGVAHSSGAVVKHGVSGRDFDEPNAFINGTGVVTENMIASGAVTSAKIADGTIVNADINASAAIAQSKVADLTTDLAAKVNYAIPTNAQSGTGASAYTFVLADASRLTTATGTSAKTFTIPPQSSVTWIANSIIRVVNYGSGDLTIAGGSGVTVTNAAKTLAQYESAALIRTGSDAWTLAPFGGGTSSPSALTFNSSTTTVVPAGCKNARMVIVGGGASGGTAGAGTDTNIACGGIGGTVNSTLQTVTPGETLTITVGSTGSTSSVAGSFGTQSAAGGSGTSGLGENGTAVAGFGTFAANGCGLIRGGPNAYAWAVGAGSPGGGRPTGGPNNYGSMNAVANTGSGGSQGTTGASGVVVIQFF